MAHPECQETQKHKVAHRIFRFVGKAKTKKNLMKYDNELIGHSEDNHIFIMQLSIHTFQF